MKAVFLDRDGTIDVGIPRYPRVDSVEKVELLPNTLKGLKLLATLDYAVFIVTNQTGIAEGLITLDDFERINAEVLRQIAPSGIRITETYLCPHGEEDDCACRKPKPKLLLDAADRYDIDLASSWTIGDRLSDVQTGINAGTRTILVRTGEVTDSSDATYVADDLLQAIEYIVSVQ